MKKIILLFLISFILMIVSCAPLTHVSSSFNELYDNVENIQYDQYGWMWYGNYVW